MDFEPIYPGFEYQESHEFCYLLFLFLSLSLEIDPRKRGIDVGAILGLVGNDIAIIAILL